MRKLDETQGALQQVEKIADSEAIRGETLLRSRTLKQQAIEMREQLEKRARERGILR